MRKLAISAAAIVLLGIGAIGCSKTYDHDATVEELMDTNGLTKEQAECFASALEDSLGEDTLNDAVNDQEDGKELSQEVIDAQEAAATECLLSE